jgi:hypothetical protein
MGSPHRFFNARRRRFRADAEISPGLPGLERVTLISEVRITDLGLVPGIRIVPLLGTA